METLLQLALRAGNRDERENFVPSVRVQGFALTAGTAGCFGRSVSGQ